MSPPSAPLLLLVGPTAVGKTEIALELALRLGGEIVSADSRLFYRGMDIGTAKPTAEQRTQVNHHLIDIADPDESVSLAVFQQKAQAAITDIRQRGRLPMLVGGTGQYIRAVTEGWAPPQVKPDERMRLVLQAIIEARGGDWLHQRLTALDPEAAARIDPRNARRTIRAMEVILTTGRKFSEQRRRDDLGYALIALGLTRPRPDIYARIDQRIETMFAKGFLEEVTRLLAAGYSPSLPNLSAIGYRQCIRVIGGEMSVEQAKGEMRRATRQLVRRQANWFKMSDPGIVWFDISSPRMDEIARYVSRAL